MSGSPLLVDDWVIVTPGGDQGRAMIAFHAADGTTAWAAGDDPAAYTSPAHVQIGGQSQLLSFNGAGLRGFALDGQPLWLFPWVTQGERQRVNVAQPLVVQPTTADPRHSYVLISSGYGMGMSLVEISFRDERWLTREVWHSNGLKSKMSNFVVRDGYVYGLDNGILTCLDINRGEAMWQRGRYGHGHLLVVHDKLLIQSGSGVVVLLPASPQWVTELRRCVSLQDVADGLLLQDHPRQHVQPEGTTLLGLHRSLARQPTSAREQPLIHLPGKVERLRSEHRTASRYRLRDQRRHLQLRSRQGAIKHIVIRHSAQVT